MQGMDKNPKKDNVINITSINFKYEIYYFL